MTDIDLTFQRHPWPETKADYRSEFQCKGMLLLPRRYI